MSEEAAGMAPGMIDLSVAIDISSFWCHVREDMVQWFIVSALRSGVAITYLGSPETTRYISPGRIDSITTDRREDHGRCYFTIVPIVWDGLPL